MTRKGALPVKTKQAICADAVAGLRVKEIAERHHVHRVTVSKVLARFRREVPNNILADPEGDFKTRLKTKAIVAVESGLDDLTDSYKRGNLGVSVLKGVGVFQDEQPRGVYIQLGTVPSQWAERYQGQAERMPEEKKAPCLNSLEPK